MSTTSFRRTLTVAALALAAALAAACGPGSAAGPEATATESVDGVGAIGTGGPTTASEPPAGPTDISPTYPDTAEGYANEVLEAWAGDQPSWLEALTSEGVYDEIVDLNASPYDEWTAPSACTLSRHPRRCDQNSATHGSAARVNSAVISMNGRSRSAVIGGCVCIGASRLSPARTRWSSLMTMAVAVPPFDKPNMPMRCGSRAPRRPAAGGWPARWPR